MATWLAVAKELSIVLSVPALAMAEVRAVYLDRLFAYPSMIHADLSCRRAGQRPG